MILDTNALSAFIDGDLKLLEAISPATSLAISTIALGEYRFGILASRHRDFYEQWLISHLPGKRVLLVDEVTSQTYAEIRAELKKKGRPIPWHDLWIAAQARQHDLPLLSRNTHFDQVRHVRRLSW